MAPTGPKGEFVSYKKGSKGVMEPDSKIETHQLVIFNLKNELFDIFFKKPLDTKVRRCFSGPFFGCSNKSTPAGTSDPLTKEVERVEFLETCEGTVKVFDPFIHTPELIYWDYCKTALICSYD